MIIIINNRHLFDCVYTLYIELCILVLLDMLTFFCWGSNKHTYIHTQGGEKGV